MSLDSTRRLIYAVCDNMIHGVLMVESFLTASITCVRACVRGACVRVCACVLILWMIGITSIHEVSMGTTYWLNT